MALSERDQVRLQIGDTVGADQLLQNDEVDNFLDRRSILDSNGGTLAVNVVAAAADAAGAVAAKYARGFTFSTDGQSFNVSERVMHYQDLERALRLRAGGVSVPLSLAGTATT